MRTQALTKKKQFSLEFHSLGHRKWQKNTWIQRNWFNSGGVFAVYCLQRFVAAMRSTKFVSDLVFLREQWKLHENTDSNGPMHKSISALWLRRPWANGENCSSNFAINPLFRWPIGGYYLSICLPTLATRTNENTTEKTNIQRNRTDA